MCGRLSTTRTRWPRTLASRSASTLPAKPAPTTRVSKPIWPDIAARRVPSIDLMFFSKSPPLDGTIADLRFGNRYADAQASTGSRAADRTTWPPA